MFFFLNGAISMTSPAGGCCKLKLKPAIAGELRPWQSGSQVNSLPDCFSRLMRDRNNVKGAYLKFTTVFFRRQEG